jgi:hypothetical protein
MNFANVSNSPLSSMSSGIFPIGVSRDKQDNLLFLKIFDHCFIFNVFKVLPLMRGRNEPTY